MGKTYNTYIQSKDVYKNMQDYGTIPINTNGMSYNNTLEQEIDNKTYELYKNTYEDLDGIIIDSSNYRSIYGEQSICETDKRCELYVNKNYLEKNEINISKNNIIENKYNVLLPQSQKNKYNDLEISQYLGINQNCSYVKNLDTFLRR